MPALTEKEKSTAQQTVPFLLFLYAADREEKLAPRQLQTFLKLSQNPSWCDSEELRESLKHITSEYEKLWRNYSRKKLSFSFASLCSDLTEIRNRNPETYEKYAENLSHLILKSTRPRLLMIRSHPETVPHLDRISAMVTDPQAAMIEFAGQIREEDGPLDLIASPPSGTKIEEPAKETGTAAAIFHSPEESPPDTELTAAPAPEVVPSVTDTEPASPVTTPSVTPSDRSKEEPAEFMPLAGSDAAQLLPWSKGTHALRCIAVSEETHDTKTFRFYSPNHILFHFKPGQFVTLQLNLNGKKVARSYTISSPPSRPGTLDITVKRVSDGLVSNWLNDNLKKGDVIEVKGPNGKFSLHNHPSRKILLVSGGSGITPVMSMLRWIHDTGAEIDAVFLHAAHTRNDIIFGRELDALNALMPNVRIHTTLTREPEDSGWEGLRGRCSAAMLLEVCPDLNNRTVFCCGPDGFMRTVRESLGTIGFDLNYYFEESFGSAAKAEKKKAEAASEVVEISFSVAGAGGEPQKTEEKTGAAGPAALHFAQSGLEVFGGDMGLPILDIAEEVGIEIVNSCRSGSCGTCKVRKKSGIVSEDNRDGLNEWEISEGYILTCVSTAKGYVELEI